MKFHPTSRWLSALFIAAVCVAGLSTPGHASYVTTNLGPSKVQPSKGSVGSQPMSVLATQDLSGNVTDLTKAQRYTPTSSGFVGVFYFTIPSDMSLAAASGISVTANYYGEPTSTQTWTFQVRDPSTKGWITLGTNSGAALHTWKSYSWALTGDLGRFLDSNGYVRVRYQTTTGKDTSDLDSLTLAVTRYVADPPPPTTSETTEGARTAFKGSLTTDPSQVNFVANVADMQILVGVGQSKINAVHAANPADPIYMYQKIGGIHGPDSTSPTGDPGYSQVVSQDLFWYGPSGKPVTMPDNGWYWLDIITPSKRAAWTQILIANVQAQLAQGYDAVFFDNACIIDPSLISEFPSNYSDAAYYAAVGQIVADVRAAIPGHKIILNSYTGGAAQGLRGLELMANADGLFFEDFAYKDSGKFFDPARYTQVITDFASVVASGKMAVGMDYALSTDMQRRMWSYASYLIVNSPRSYHFFAATNATSDLQSYPEDSLDIGPAQADAVIRGDGLVTRAYDKGTAVVNPTTASVTYTMGSGSWQQLVLSGGGTFPASGSATWTAMSGTTVKLAPDTAVVVRPAQ